MTNYEKYKDELTKFAMADGGFAVFDGKPTLCSGANCGSCLFNLSDGLCNKARLEWLDAEYEEPKAGNSCKACKYFHLGEGLTNTGICSISFGATTVFDMCESYHERGESND